MNRFLLLTGLFLSFYTGSAQCGQDYDQPVKGIVAKANVPKGDVPRAVFAGSSSFRLWKNMAESFPEFEVVNAGIGGSCFADLYKYREELIAQTQPDLLIIYEGDNDAVYLEQSDEILVDARELLHWIRTNYPDLPVYLLSPKPSPRRWDFAPKYYRTNTLLRDLAAEFQMGWIDCWPGLTGENGGIREELYIADGIHLSAEGNALLGQIIHDALFSETAEEALWNAQIDAWHGAAAKADGDAYFEFFSSTGAFQGTDGSEFWPVAEFEAWAQPYFERGSAWTFVPFGERQFFRAAGAVYFTERLDSEHMGKCRGTGVLVREAGNWKLDFYSLSFEVPNEVVGELVPLAKPERVEALKFQAELDQEYKNPEHSPLSEEDRANFHGHDFYPVDMSYRVMAKLDRTPKSKPFDMATTTGVPRKYRKYGDLTFTLHGVVHRVPVYQSLRLMEMEEYKNHLFFPFKDRTTGVETYATGRFMDLEIPEGDEIVLDFNKAYNPYCAYSDRYSCPITPAESYIDAEVKAGIRGPVGH